MDDKHTIKLQIMAVLLLLTAISEFTVGIMTNSLALIADAWHVMSDEIAIIIGIISLRWSKKQSTMQATYGWARAEIVGALINGIFLLSSVVFIFLLAIERFINPPDIEKPFLIIIVGGIGLIVNIFGILLVHDHEHNLNFKGVFYHMLGDTLGSVAAILSGILIWYTKWNYIDPILSVFIICIITCTIIPFIKRCILILLQKVPSHIDLDKIKENILKIEHINDVHDLHVWAIIDNKLIATLHVNMQYTNIDEYQKIMNDISTLLHSNDIHSTTIQPEFKDNLCQYECKSFECTSFE